MTTTTKNLKVVFTADYDWLRIAEMQGLEIDWDAEPLSVRDDGTDECADAARLANESEWECSIDPDDSEIGAAVVVEPRDCDTALRAGDIVLTSGPGGDVAFLRATNPQGEIAMPGFIIHRHGTSEVLTLSRDPSESHPEWVHDQLRTTGEHSLQSYLDECERVWPSDENGVDIFGLELVRST